jgi:hypothetical protein
VEVADSIVVAVAAVAVGVDVVAAGGVGVDGVDVAGVVDLVHQGVPSCAEAQGEPETSEAKYIEKYGQRRQSR